MDLLSLVSGSDTETVSAGATIFDAGSAADCLYVVIEGQVDIMSGDEVLDTISMGEFFGEMALIDARPRSATAVARTNCKLATIDERLFLYMVQQTPFFSLHVMRVIAERLRRMNERSDA